MRTFLVCLVVFGIVVPNIGLNSKIKTVVVLMEENRSFDHMLGWMNTISPNVNGVNGTQCNYLDPTNKQSPLYCTAPTAPYIAPFDPDHGTYGTRIEIFGANDTLTYAPMDGFVYRHSMLNEPTPDAVMYGFSPDRVPVISTLAQQGAMFDNYFAGIPGPTEPNRMMFLSGTSHGLTDNTVWRLALGQPQKTIFNQVKELNMTYAVYANDFTETMLLDFFRTPSGLEHIHWFDKFIEDAKQGTLPNFIFINPRYFADYGQPASDQHPRHDVRIGENLMQTVYEALRASPQWNETALIITYDEHGGFYDHVPTPLKDVPNPDGRPGDMPSPWFNFTQLGIRIPFIVVSPWVDPMLVHDPLPGEQPTPESQYTSCSLLGTLKNMWGFKDFLTKRDAWSNTFESIFNRTTPRTDMPMTLGNFHSDTRTQKYRNERSAFELNRKPGDLQLFFVQLAAALHGELEVPEFNTVAEAATYGRAKLEEYYAKHGVKFPFPPRKS